jgi:hypothetical protein
MVVKKGLFLYVTHKEGKDIRKQIVKAIQYESFSAVETLNIVHGNLLQSDNLLIKSAKENVDQCDNIIHYSKCLIRETMGARKKETMITIEENTLHPLISSLNCSE